MKFGAVYLGVSVGMDHADRVMLGFGKRESRKTLLLIQRLLTRVSA